jgi:phage shock protein PspC (stress-responsive transcriptional regulator)
MTCPNCQKEIVAGSKFCYNCGAKQAEAGVPGMAQAAVGRKRLMRSSTDKKIGGVCAGLADYFDLDPTILRVIWVLLVLCAGSGLVFYIVLWIVLPLAPAEVVHTSAGVTT